MKVPRIRPPDHMLERWRTKLAQSYVVWRLYHFLVADAVAIQKATKYRFIYEFLAGDLGKAADVGCGPGVFTRYLCSHAKRVWAVDINVASLRRTKARHRARKNLECVVTEVACLPFPNGHFDTLLFLEVLEHLWDDAAALRELCRVLAPGGKIVLSVPVPPGEVNEDPRGHKREGYQLHELVGLLESTGFKVQKHRFAEFKFSRLGARLVRDWRGRLPIPAPIFLSWVGYLDYLLDSERREKGDFLAATVVVLATKQCESGGC